MGTFQLWNMTFSVRHKDGTQRCGLLPDMGAGSIEDQIIDLMEDELADTIVITLGKLGLHTETN